MKRLGLGVLLLAIGGIAGYAVRYLETLFLDRHRLRNDRRPAGRRDRARLGGGARYGPRHRPIRQRGGGFVGRCHPEPAICQMGRRSIWV